LAYGAGTPSTPSAGEDGNGSWDDSPLFKAKPEKFDLEGTLDRVVITHQSSVNDGGLLSLPPLEGVGFPPPLMTVD
jgi:hypothetical protein